MNRVIMKRKKNNERVFFQRQSMGEKREKGRKKEKKRGRKKERKDIFGQSKKQNLN